MKHQSFAIAVSYSKRGDIVDSGVVKLVQRREKQRCSEEVQPPAGR